jgi:hypothetical protein
MQKRVYGRRKQGSGFGHTKIQGKSLLVRWPLPSVRQWVQVDEDTWHPHLYDFTQPEVADQWGTANQMNEFVARKSFNDPDRGMFVAPPV